jgi:hypothetical protein
MKFLAFILICLLVGCCWYWFSHANEIDPNAFKISQAEKSASSEEQVAAWKKRAEGKPTWPVVLCLIFIVSLSFGIVIPFGNVFSLTVAVICCLILIVTGNYMYICLGLLLQIIIIPMGLLAVGKLLLN